MPCRLKQKYRYQLYVIYYQLKHTSGTHQDFILLPQWEALGATLPVKYSALILGTKLSTCDKRPRLSLIHAINFRRYAWTDALVSTIYVWKR